MTMDITQMQQAMGSPSPQPQPTGKTMTVQQVQQIMSSGKISPDDSAQALGHSTGMLGNIISGVGNIVTGYAKSGVHTGMELGKFTAEAGSSLPGPVGDFFKGRLQAGTQEMEKPQYQPQGTMQDIGYGAGEVSQFLAPAGVVKKAETGIQAIEGLPTAAKVVGKALTEAGTGGIVSFAQTGDPQQAITTALTFGLTKSLTGTLGAGAKALGIPEHMYSTIFKNTANDMLNELKTTGIATLQKENPAAFQQFVDAGIIKTGTGGTFTVDPTLARQALNRGLRGSIQNMANVVTKDTLQNELDAQKIAENYKAPVPIQGFDKLSGLLNTVAEDYKNVGQGEIANKASSFSQALESGKGNVDAKTALGIRRFLDGMRARSSYNPQMKLSTTAENFKYWSDLVRKGVNQIPGMSDVMKNYSFNIDALTSLAKTAAARGNQQLVNMLDVLIFEGGMTGGVPGSGATMTLARKALTTPYGATQIGSAIEGSGSLTKTGAAFKYGLSNAIGGVENQGQQ